MLHEDTNTLGTDEDLCCKGLLCVLKRLDVGFDASPPIHWLA
jgi:hypothetical protein